jgi:PPP family 3-phenylpropionic acid transporter
MIFPAALAALVVMGLSYRSTIPLLDSLVTRVLPDPTRQYGRLRVAGSFGFILISLFLQLTGLVTGDSALPILVAFGAAALAAAGAALFLPRGPRPAPRVSPRAAAGGFDARFWIVLAVIFLGRFGIAAYYSFFSLYLKQAFPGAGVSMLWAIGPAAEIITIWFSGRLIRRWGIRVMLTVSLAAISLRLCLFVAAPVIAVVAAAQVLHAFTFGTFHTTAVAWVNGRVARERRGLGMSIYNAVGTGLPTVIATSVGGYVLQAGGFSTLFISYAIVPLLGIGILALFGRELFPTRARFVT